MHALGIVKETQKIRQYGRVRQQAETKQGIRDRERQGEAD